MKIITLNVNGIRSAAKKGVFEWLISQQAEVICLQEIRVNADQMLPFTTILPGYHCYFESAVKPGYSGVAIYSREAPVHVKRKLGFALSDDEGRYIHIEWEGLTVASLYMPSGTSGETRQALKYQFMDKFEKILADYRQREEVFIICGDWNIAHRPIDLKNWKANQNNSGFLPEERAWLDQLFDRAGWLDAFRVLNQSPEQYTWWSHRGRAWEKNVGWRIDYQVVSPQWREAIQRVDIYKEERFSDHAPLIVEYRVPR